MIKFTGNIHKYPRWRDAYAEDERIWRKGEQRPDYRQCYLDRINLLNRMRTDRAIVPILKKYYETNPVAFILDWAFTYDPRNVGTEYPPNMPFCLFERQIDMIQFVYEALEDKEKGLWEKSRDYGATWVACGLSVWAWLYRPGSSVGWGSRKETLVDKLGDPDSIFEKIRQIIRALPPELRPVGYREKDHLTFMKCINPENGSTITGEAGDNIGRGGRKSIYFLDEAAHVDRPELIEASLSANTNVRIDISSVNGVGNVFYRNRKAGLEWEPGKKIPRGKLRVMVLDWRDHPAKNDEWYEREKKSFAEKGLQHIFAQEVDRDYAAAVQGVLIKADWVRAAFDAFRDVEWRKANGLLTPHGKRVAGQDAADGGEDASALAIMHGVFITYLQLDHRSAELAAPGMLLNANVQQCDEYWYESIGVGTGVKVAAHNMKSTLRFTAKPWVPNAKVVDPLGDIIAGTKPGDKDRKCNRDYFRDYKAQSSWALRMRFKRIYEWYREGKPQDPDEIILIDPEMENAQRLEAELSQPTYSSNGAGKIVIDKAPNGTKSPNLFDAVVIASSPKRVMVEEEGFTGNVNPIGTPEYGSIF
ncbi:hypothetical protein e2701_00018 [Klebsiella phage e270.1]|uniref:TerL protein n=1 Tax=Klebsiella pneumoniae TaxID=573 RepID=UPI000F7DCB7F|nr:TerL protein [Klebsiella pneumoniae]WDQ26630.1 hypothetical protein phiKPNH21_00017 [Klebsiella phage phi_KPN_H2]WMT10457.1 hypothetical protein phi270_00062 [Klebsiella phage phi_270]WMT10578.1 hypothetical protein e2701_00018 [Klebsiella phage e270.1]WMT10665.1 hypothetical protein e2702_00018 [Klebsiella phage e270.2]RTA29716.1 TerL protein [Klebsiella pneumoniae subsp. pneumoniae]